MTRPEISLLEGLATTRAIRRYTDAPIPDEDLAEILWYAGRAPSGTNRQAFRFLVLRRDDDVARPARELLGRSFRASWVDKRAAIGVRVGTGSPSDGPKERMAASMQHYVDHLEQTPVIVLVGLERYRPASPYEGASVYPACQNLLLAARALGYGGALTGFHHAVEAELRELLGIPAGVALSACITLGVPAGRHGPLRRKPIAELTHDGRWGRPADWLDGVDPDPARGS
jgi:nitroreductase